MAMIFIYGTLELAWRNFFSIRGMAPASASIDAYDRLY
jgi:hypothetical protein